jgi:hypothetical protein
MSTIDKLKDDADRFGELADVLESQLREAVYYATHALEILDQLARRRTGTTGSILQGGANYGPPSIRAANRLATRARVGCLLCRRIRRAGGPGAAAVR